MVITNNRRYRISGLLINRIMESSNISIRSDIIKEMQKNELEDSSGEIELSDRIVTEGINPDKEGK